MKVSMCVSVKAKSAPPFRDATDKQTQFEFIAVYKSKDTTVYYQICLSEMVAQGFNNPGVISPSTPKERKFESG